MLGIVIANWNGEKLIDKCLLSLENQSFKDFKVYIIDNDSKDNSKKVIRSYSKRLNIDLIEMSYNSGFAPANNIGIKKAINDGCDYILGAVYRRLSGAGCIICTDPDDKRFYCRCDVAGSFFQR